MSTIASDNGWSEAEVELVLGAPSDIEAARLMGITEEEAAALRSEPIPKKQKTKK